MEDKTPDRREIFQFERVAKIDRGSLPVKFLAQISARAQQRLEAGPGLEADRSPRRLPRRVIEVERGPGTVDGAVLWHENATLGAICHQGLPALTRQHVDELLDLGPPGLFLAELVLQATHPAGIEVEGGAFEDGPAIVPEFSTDELSTHRLDVRVDAQILAVDGDTGERTTGCRRTGLTEDAIPEELTDLPRVLAVVVEGQAVDPANLLFAVDEVKLHLREGRVRLFEPEDPFLNPIRSGFSSTMVSIALDQ